MQIPDTPVAFGIQQCFLNTSFPFLVCFYLISRVLKNIVLNNVQCVIAFGRDLHSVSLNHVATI